MGAPYGRIVVLHITLIAGGFLVMSLKAPVLGVLLLLALKAGLRPHHAAPQPAEAGGARSADARAPSADGGQEEHSVSHDDECDELCALLRSRFPIILIQSHEEPRILELLKKGVEPREPGV